jgi:DNA primase
VSDRKFDIKRVDVLDMLTSMSLRNISIYGDEVNCSCPFPGHSFGDMKPSFYMNMHSTLWLCHGCKKKGDAVSFLCDYENVSPILALRWLRERYESDFREPEGSIREHIRKIVEAEKPEVVTHQPELPPEKLGGFYVPTWSRVREAYNKDEHPAFHYLLDRGLTPETLTEWQFVYDPRTDRLVFPVYDEEKRLIGLKGRSWHPEHMPKYLALGDTPRTGVRLGFQPLRTAAVLFGLDRVGHVDELIVVEGELNAVAMHQKGFSNTVGIAGSLLSNDQIVLVRRFCERVILFFDSDDAGKAGLHGSTDARGRYQPGAVKKLHPYMPVKVVPDHEGDAMDLSAERIAQLISEAAPPAFHFQ